jgi:hypothetical protein
MNKKVVLVFIPIILFISCKREKSTIAIEKNEITNEFRLQFLNEILSDTLELKLIQSKSNLISNSNILPPPSYDVDFFRESNYISEVLEINDTVFVQKQFDLNPTFNFDDLSKLGFIILDVKSIVKKGGGYYKILDEVNLYYKNCDTCCMLVLSKPIFNKEKNKAYLRMGCGSGGRSIILEKKLNKWKVIKELDYWVS